MRKLSTYTLLIALLTVTACTGGDEQERPETPEEVDIRPDVIFSVADDQPLRVYIESQGITEPIREILIRPRISGFVTKSKLDEGTHVSKGDTILAFDNQEWTYELQQAQNEYETARVEYNIEQRQRRQSGSEEGVNDDMVRISTGLAEAELARERARLNLSYATISAPFTGELSAENRIAEGAFIATGSELGKLIDDTTVLIRFDVLEAELSKLETGMRVELFTPSGIQKEGRISALSPVVDSESKTGQVVVEVANHDGSLRPGMTVEGRIQIESHTGKARIPRAAILERDGGRTLVFKLNGDTVEWIYVEPEFETSEWAIVNHEEINPGDTLAVDRHFALSHLQQVRPRMAGQIVQEGNQE